MIQQGHPSNKGNGKGKASAKASAKAKAKAVANDDDDDDDSAEADVEEITAVSWWPIRHNVDVNCGIVGDCCELWL